MTRTDPKTRLDHRRMHSRVEVKVESLNGCDVRVDLTGRRPSSEFVTVCPKFCFRSVSHLQYCKIRASVHCICRIASASTLKQGRI